MNLFGFDISELDLANFVAAMRLVTIGVVTISFLLFFRQKRWTILAMGIAVLVVVGWLTTFYPLARSTVSKRRAIDCAISAGSPPWPPVIPP